MPKKKDRFIVFGTADYFKDRDRSPGYRSYALEKKETESVSEAKEIARKFMLQNPPMGRNAFVVIEQKMWYRGGWNGGAIGKWVGDEGTGWRKDFERDPTV